MPVCTHIQNLLVAILLHFCIHKWRFVGRLVIQSISSTLIQIFRNEKSSSFLLHLLLWLHLRGFSYFFWGSVFWCLYRGVCFFKNWRIVFYREGFAQDKRIRTVIDVLFLNLYQTFALTIVHHILENLCLIGSRFSPCPSEIGGRIDMFIDKLPTSWVSLSKQDFERWVFKIDWERIASYD